MVGSFNILDVIAVGDDLTITRTNLPDHMDTFVNAVIAPCYVVRAVFGRGRFAPGDFVTRTPARGVNAADALLEVP